MNAKATWAASDLSEESVIALLDGETQGEWPVFRSEEVRLAYHALRLIVFRKPKGDGYAIILETLLGAEEGKLYLLRSIVSPDAVVLAEDRGDAELYLERRWNPTGENVIVGPAGEVTVAAEDLEALEPKRATVSVQEDMLYTLLVRAYLQAEPTAFWASEDVLRSRLAADFDLNGYEHFLEFIAFEHVVGTTWIAGDPGDIDAAWRKLPSESETYRSLAQAIVAGDASLFVPGKSNLDWRLHLDAPKDSRRLL